MFPRPPADAQRPIVAETLASIRTLIAALGRSARLVEERTGVTNAQLFLVRELRGRPNATINELAARAMTSQSTVSVLVTRLEDGGLVKRRRAGDDARQVRVSLTAAGRRLADRAAEPPTARLIHALEAMPDDELAALAGSLDALLTRLNLTSRETMPLFEAGPSIVARGTQRRKNASSDRKR